MPGDTLPLKVVRRQDRLKLESALSAAAPYTRWIAVVRASSHERFLASNRCVACPLRMRMPMPSLSSLW